MSLLTLLDSWIHRFGPNNPRRKTGPRKALAFVVKETIERNSGDHLGEDPKELFSAGTKITHVSVNADYEAIPAYSIESHNDWPVHIARADITLSDGRLTILVSIGSFGSAMDLDYTIIIYEPDVYV